MDDTDAILQRLVDNEDEIAQIEWSDLRTLLLARFQQIAPELNTDELRVLVDQVKRQLETHQNTPWTIQRLSELITRPRAQYNDVIKYVRAVIKVLDVVSPFDAFPSPRKKTTKPTIQPQPSVIQQSS